eukprot:gene31943-41437_t
MAKALLWGVNSWQFISCILFFWTLSLSITTFGKVYRPSSSTPSSSPTSSLASTSALTSRLLKRKTLANVATGSSKTIFVPLSDCINKVQSSSRKRLLRPSQFTQSRKRHLNQIIVGRKSRARKLTTRYTAAALVRGGSKVEVLAKVPIPTNFDDVVHSNASIAAGTGNIFTKFDENNKKVLTYYGLMLAGAIARSASATANGVIPEFKWSILSRGAGSQFIMSIPHGAVSYAVTETTKKELARFVKKSSLDSYIPLRYLNPAMDFLSSSVSTFICSTISTPQMVLTDQIMAGSYNNFFAAVYSIAMEEMFLVAMDRPGTTLENTLLGAIAAAGACCVMIPVDTIKTRLVLQKIGDGGQQYAGMIDCFNKILKQEGVGSFYRSLTPRLLSVMPMIGIQFGVYELVKRLMIGLPAPKSPAGKEYYHTHHDFDDSAATNSSKKQ